MHDLRSKYLITISEKLTRAKLLNTSKLIFFAFFFKGTAHHPLKNEIEYLIIELSVYPFYLFFCRLISHYYSMKNKAE